VVLVKKSRTSKTLQFVFTPSVEHRIIKDNYSTVLIKTFLSPFPNCILLKISYTCYFKEVCSLRNAF